MKARSVTFVASATDEKLAIAIGPLESREVELFRAHDRRLATSAANAAYQALRHDAIQSGHEVVGIHTHVQEATDDVESVIRMHGREHEVTRQSRLHRDLRGLRIAHLADHDRVGIVTQH